MKSFLLIIAVLTNKGEMQMSTQFVDSCPEQEVVSTALGEMIKENKILAWVARCMPASKPMGV